MNVTVRVGVVAVLLMAMLGLMLSLLHWRHAWMPHVVLLLGLVLLALGAWRRWRAAAMTRWDTTTATLVTCEPGSFEEPYEYMTVTYRYPVVSYTYTYAGQTRLGSRVAGSVRDIALSDSDDPEHGTPGSKAFWKDWAAGTTLRAYVNPEHPEQAVLTLARSRQQTSQDLALIVAGILIASLWAVMIFG